MSVYFFLSLYKPFVEYILYIYATLMFLHPLLQYMVSYEVYFIYSNKNNKVLKTKG